MSSLVLYMHVHQPYRVKHYTLFDAGNDSQYFNADTGARESNIDILNKVSEKSYLPTNKILKHLLETHPEFKLSLSMTGTLLEQLRDNRPDVLETFRELVATGRVEILAETYHHSLAYFYNLDEFEKQVEQHSALCQELLGYKPHSFRNTELAYNNSLGIWADKKGYEAIITEGWDPILAWRSPNHVYKPPETQNIKLLCKNYKLSDDIAFRFGNKSWSEWPLSAEKFAHWVHSDDNNPEVINLFMDYETFGEHQWSESGIFAFLKSLPFEWLKKDGSDFETVSGAARRYQVKDELDVNNTITWADSERDLSAWMGNSMQTQALQSIYELSEAVKNANDQSITRDWQMLQTSDHFYYMSTKYFNDGDVHAYFSPYESPYEAQMNYMNALLDLKSRLSLKGVL